MKNISRLTSTMKDTIEGYKEYYRVEKLESQLVQLGALLHESFKLSFNRIVELSMNASEPSEYKVLTNVLIWPSIGTEGKVQEDQEIAGREK